MKTILELFLDALNIEYTRRFTRTLYQEHPHKYNMYGLKRMLDIYGVKTMGVYVNSKDLSELNYPCILHTHGDFIIGLHCDADRITFLQYGKVTTLAHDAFRQIWTGNALVVEETTDTAEPDYKKHQHDQLISNVKAFSIPIMLTLATIVGFVSNISILGIFNILRISLSLAGGIVSIMLIEKQLYGESHYGDRVCSLFHHADCNSVLDGPMAKVFGISWSEVGLGYFIANILLLSFYSSSFGAVAVVNWVAMFYGVWSVYYQWCVAKSWCVLCMIVQVIIWLIGIAAFFSCLTTPYSFGFASNLLSCVAFAICIMAVHQYAAANVTDKERVHAVQQYRALKANSDVAQTLIEKSEYYETSLSDSSIIFGNPKAKILVTILSNPHCNPCARMHKKVENLLNSGGDNICVQYIFSSFNAKWEDSIRYLISCYFFNNTEEALCKFALWYAKDKYDYKKIIRRNEKNIHTEAVENEMKKHKIWREKTSIATTPTVLVNGHILPKEYELEDLDAIVGIIMIKKNILQDINGKHVPLAAN